MNKHLMRFFLSEIESSSRHYVADAHAQAVINANNENLIKIIRIAPSLIDSRFNSLILEKRTCGQRVAVHDIEKSKKIQLTYGLKFQERESMEKVRQLLLPESVQFDVSKKKLFGYSLDMYIKSKTKSKEIDYCPVSLGRCRCEAISYDSSFHEELLNAKRESFITDNEIESYIKRNPENRDLGKFGKPQDKYRNGAYGVHGMEFDHWRR